jgi:undecaprenyl pyrophosphate phosphatase UppP
MNLKKSLERRVRGWLPKEPNVPSCQRTHNHKAPKIGIQIGIVTFIMGFVGGTLGAMGYSLGLFLGVEVYVWLIVIGIVIVAATNLLRTKQKKEHQRS